MTENERTQGERTRMAEQIARIRALIDGLEMTSKLPATPASESAQAVADAAIRLVSCASRLDAYQLNEVDRRRPLLPRAPGARQSIAPVMPPPAQITRRQPIELIHTGPGGPCSRGGAHDPAPMTRLCRKCGLSV